MELVEFEMNWREYCIEPRKDEKCIYLRDLFSGTRGAQRIGGFTAVRFVQRKDQADDLFLRPVDINGKMHCCSWDADREQWNNIGRIYRTNEWGNYQFTLYWRTSAIVLEKTKQQIALSSIFSQCLGEKYEGLLFIGTGILEGERMILKLDTKKRLAGFLDPQDCYYYDQDEEEWKLYGKLLKGFK